MPRTSALIVAAIQPVLVGTAFIDAQTGEPPEDDASGASHGRGAGVIWCAPTPTFRRGHPSVTAALDREHPDGCTDLSVYVDADGRLERADIEMLSIDEGLVGQPIEAALPVLADRISRLLG